jgi:hypothetical protein
MFHFYPCDDHFVVRISKYYGGPAHKIHTHEENNRLLDQLRLAHPHVTYIDNTMRIPYTNFDENCIIGIDRMSELGITLFLFSDKRCHHIGLSWYEGQVDSIDTRTERMLECIWSLIERVHVTLHVDNVVIPERLGTIHTRCLILVSSVGEIIYGQLLDGYLKTMESSDSKLYKLVYKGFSPIQLFDKYPQLCNVESLTLGAMASYFKLLGFPNLIKLKTCDPKFELPGPSTHPHLVELKIDSWNNILTETVLKCYSMGIRTLRLGCFCSVGFDVEEIKQSCTDLTVYNEKKKMIIGKQLSSLFDISKESEYYKT